MIKEQVKYLYFLKDKKISWLLFFFSFFQSVFSFFCNFLEKLSYHKKYNSSTIWTILFYVFSTYSKEIVPSIANIWEIYHLNYFTLCIINDFPVFLAFFDFL